MNRQCRDVLKYLFWREAKLLGFKKKYKCGIKKCLIKNITATKLDYLGFHMVTAVIWGSVCTVFTFLVFVMHRPFSTY